MLIGQDIAVLGAGVSGLCAARALALRGARVTLYEQAEAITEVGAGLQLSPNGLAVLEALGLDVSGMGQPSKAVELCDALTGKTVLKLDFEKYKPNSEFLMLHRADLIRCLEDGAREAGVKIMLAHAAEAVHEDEQAVQISFTNGRTVQHDMLIGADGVKSIVRPVIAACLMNDSELSSSDQKSQIAAPFFTGQVAWRAVVPAHKAPAIFAQAQGAQVHMAAKKHVVVYPLRSANFDTGLVNIVAVEEQAQWTEEGWHQTGDPKSLQSRFSGLNTDLNTLLAQVDTVSKWGLFRHEVAQHWFSARCVMIGDAAHPTLPFLAQGANLALEDAWVLADCLATLPREDAFTMLQERRLARVSRVIEAANGNARNYHLSGPLRKIAHLVLRIGGRLFPRLAVDKFSWLYDEDVTAP